MTENYKNCLECDYFDGINNIVCETCPVFHRALDKTIDFRKRVNNKPTPKEIAIFRLKFNI